MIFGTLKFNINGHTYTVSRYILSKHPNTMLARTASDKWHEEPHSEIYIDRDGERFKYCLDYLQYGHVLLPLEVSKDALVEDLKYYGVENINEDSIKYNTSNQIKIADGEQLVKNSTHICEEAAKFSYQNYIETGKLSIKYNHFTVIGTAINKACNDTAMFDRCLSKLGLTFKETNGPYRDYNKKKWDKSANYYILTLLKLEK